MKVSSKAKPRRPDVWTTEIRTKKPLPKKILDLIRKYEDIEVSE